MEPVDYRGCISWSKAMCGAPQTEYGSDVKTDTPIVLTISQSESRRSLSKTRFYRKDDIIQVEMTPLQWAEFLTVGNIHNGVPCTIKKVFNESIEGPKEVENTIKQFKVDTSEEFKSVVTSFNSIADELEDLLKEGKTGKKNIEHIISKIRDKANVIPANIDFLKDRFVESMESIVVRAKAEISAYAESKIIESGIETVKAKALLGDK